MLYRQILTVCGEQKYSMDLLETKKQLAKDDRETLKKHKRTTQKTVPPKNYQNAEQWFAWKKARDEQFEMEEQNKKSKKALAELKKETVLVNHVKACMNKRRG